MRQKLLELGANTIATLPKLFKSRPSFDGQCHIHVSDFFEGLKYYGYNIIKEEAVLLCRYLIQMQLKVLILKNSFLL